MVGCQGQRASGKLYDACTGYRKKLSNCGLIQRNFKARQAQSVPLQLDPPGRLPFNIRKINYVIYMFFR